MSLPVEYVWPHQLTTEDFRWLGKANAAVAPFNRMNVEGLYQGLMDGSLHLLRMLPPNEGVLLLSPVEQNGARRLLLWACSGRGISRNIRRIADVLLRTAREWGCEAVESIVVDPRLARAMMRSGARPESVTLVLPVGGNDGR